MSLCVRGGGSMGGRGCEPVCRGLIGPVGREHTKMGVGVMGVRVGACGGEGVWVCGGGMTPSHVVGSPGRNPKP